MTGCVGFVRLTAQREGHAGGKGKAEAGKLQVAALVTGVCGGEIYLGKGGREGCLRPA